MKLIKTQYKKLEKLIPIAKKAKISHYKCMCAMLYITKNGCKWRNLPKKHEKLHTVYVKFRRLSKNGTIAKAIASFLLKHYFRSYKKTKTA